MGTGRKRGRMTDKEIIIDGVNVAGCGYFEPYLGNGDCMIQGLGINESILYCDCKDNPNCYYKQSKRKEQECAIFKQSENEALEIIAELNAECEELKDLNRRLHNQRESYWKEYQSLQVKNDRYKQALEKIEEYCKNHKYTGWVDAKGIMETINEVKGVE